MTNRTKGTLIGIALSLAAVAIWIVLGAFLEIIAGIAGAFMGILFIWGYNKFNPEDEGKYKIIVSVVVMIVDIILAELLTLLVICGMHGISFSLALSIPEIQSAMIIDIVIGVVLSSLVFPFYIIGERRKRLATQMVQNTVIDTTAEETKTEEATKNESGPVCIKIGGRESDAKTEDKQVQNIDQIEEEKAIKKRSKKYTDTE